MRASAGTEWPDSQATGMPAPIRVALIDDDPMVLAALDHYLSPSTEVVVVATADDGSHAVNLVKEHAPDVVIIDIQMPDLDGISATRALRSQFPQIKVILLTSFDQDDYLLTALDAGASGFLLKSLSPQELIAAIKQANNGNKVVAPGPTTRLIDHYIYRARPERVVADIALSARENQVLLLVCRGMSNGQIAQELYLGETTIKTHVSSIMRKMKVASRLEIVVFAYEHHLLG